MEELVLGLVYDALIVFTALVVALLAGWLKKKLGVETLKKIQAELATKQELATMAVRFVEQVYKDLKGEEKYQKAAEWLVAQAEKAGLKLTTDEVKGLIEAALRQLKDAFGNEWAKQLR
jgi:LL-H family phage holin